MKIVGIRITKSNGFSVLSRVPVTAEEEAMCNKLGCLEYITRPEGEEGAEEEGDNKGDEEGEEHDGEGRRQAKSRLCSGVKARSGEVDSN